MWSIRLGQSEKVGVTTICVARIVRRKSAKRGERRRLLADAKNGDYGISSIVLKTRLDKSV